MDFSESDEQRLIRESVRKLCRDFPDEYWEHKDAAGEFPSDFFDSMAKAGWLGIAMPEKYGGAGKGIQEAAILLEEVAASGAAMNGATPLHLSIFGMHPVVKHGSESLRSAYLPKVARGEMHVAFGVTEPNAGTDTTAIETSAKRDGDHYIVRGRKVWTTKAIESQRVLLLVRTTPRKEVLRKTDGMTLLLAELQRPEVTISPIPKLGRNAVRTCEVVYDDLPVFPACFSGRSAFADPHLLLSPVLPLRAQALLDHTIEAMLFEAVLQPCDAVSWSWPVATGCCPAATGHV